MEGGKGGRKKGKTGLYKEVWVPQKPILQGKVKYGNETISASDSLNNRKERRIVSTNP